MKCRTYYLNSGVTRKPEATCGNKSVCNQTYLLEITGKYIGTVKQEWKWFGEQKGGLKALCNHADYTSDTRLYIDKQLNVVDGYSFLVNPDTSIKVTPIKLK